MGRKWKALIIWIIVPYVFDTFVLFAIEAVFSQSVTLADWRRWTFDTRHLLAALLWCTAQGGIGTLILWMLPVRRFWIGIMAGASLAIAYVVIVARIMMAFFGGFEENIDIFVGSFDLLLPSCWAGAYAGFLRFKDRQMQEALEPEESSQDGAVELPQPEPRYIVSMTIFLFVLTGIWLAILGRLRTWW
ncbi:MAG TPA: hypothetical protein VJA94_20030 [Candidatus Angelobacter sp.]